MTQECSTSQSDTPIGRRGVVEQFQYADGAGHSVHLDAFTDFGDLLTHKGSEFGGADGGYILIRFDVDESEYSVVHVHAPAGWWPSIGQGPPEIISRAAEYLSGLDRRMKGFEAVLSGEAAEAAR